MILVIIALIYMFKIKTFCGHYLPTKSLKRFVGTICLPSPLPQTFKNIFLDISDAR